MLCCIIFIPALFIIVAQIVIYIVINFKLPKLLHFTYLVVNKLQ